MSEPSYVVLSRQSALAKELTNIANNVANADTPGYKRDDAIFTEFVRALADAPSVSQTRVGGRVLDLRAGEVIRTGARLDLAIEGRGFFVVLTPGGERLTRAGNFSLDGESRLSTADGHPVLSDGGAPIVVPPHARDVAVSTDGVVSVDGAPIGRVAIALADPATLVREGANLFRSVKPFSYAENAEVIQGFVEGSNVDAVAEIGRLIEVQRAFELGSKLLDDDHARVRRAIESFARR
jgi:flagellar basal-body rod protein FlgF